MICQKTWLPGGVAYFPYISVCLSETTRLISILLGRNVPLVTHYQNCSSNHGWSKTKRGWSDGVNRGIHLIFAYSWARPAILVAGKGRGGMFFISSVSSPSLLFLFLPCPSLSSLLLPLLSLFSLSLGDDTK